MMTDAELDDPFFKALVEAMTAPVPFVGDRVRVDGRPGVLVGVDAPHTCAVFYTVDHDGDEVRYCIADFPVRGRNPVIEPVCKDQ